MTRAKQLAQGYLDRAGLQSLGDVPVDGLTCQHQLGVKFLRAIMFPDAIVVVAVSVEKMLDKSECDWFWRLVNLFEDAYQKCLVVKLRSPNSQLQEF